MPRFAFLVVAIVDAHLRGDLTASTTSAPNRILTEMDIDKNGQLAAALEAIIDARIDAKLALLPPAPPGPAGPPGPVGPTGEPGADGTCGCGAERQGMKQISVGRYHSCGVSVDNVLYCWAKWRTGSYDMKNLLGWDNGIFVKGVQGVKQVQMGYLVGCMWKVDDTVRCFGDDNYKFMHSDVLETLGPVKDFALTKSETRQCAVAVNREGNVEFMSGAGGHSGGGCGLLFNFGSRSETKQITTEGFIKKVFLDQVETKILCAQKVDDTLICMGELGGDWMDWLHNKEGITRLIHDGDTSGGIAIDWKVKDVAFSKDQICFVLLHPGGELRCVGRKQSIEGQSNEEEWMRGLPGLMAMDNGEHPVYKSESLSSIGVDQIYASQDSFCAITVKHHLRCWSNHEGYVPSARGNYAKLKADFGIDKDDDDDATQVWSYAIGIHGSSQGRSVAIVKRDGDADGKIIQWGYYMDREWNTMPKEYYACENPEIHHDGNEGTGC